MSASSGYQRDQYPHDDKTVEHLGGVDWYEAGKEFRARPWWRRLFHVHAPQTRVVFTNGDRLDRCICGAYGTPHDMWPETWTKRL